MDAGAAPGHPARRLLHPPGRRARGQRRAGGGRRAARGFLRGHRPALSSGRGWWKLARDRRGDRHHLRACSPPSPVAEVKCQGGKARGFDCRMRTWWPSCRRAPSAPSAARSSTTSGAGPIRPAAASSRIVGRTDGTSFVEVTDPGNPKYLGDLPLHAGRASQHLARHKGLQEPRVHRGRRRRSPRNAGVRSHPVARRQHAADVQGDRALRPDRQRPQHRDQPGHRVRLSRWGTSMGGTTCGGALHMVDIREPAKPKFAGCFADPSARAAADGLHPRCPVRGVPRPRRPVPWA